MKRILLLISVVVLISSLILVTTTAASGNSSQIWYLYDETLPHPQGTLEMVKDVSLTDVEVYEQMTSGESQYWLSFNAAVSDVTFDEGQWEVNFHTCSDWTEFLTVKIGEMTPGGSFTPFTLTLASGSPEFIAYDPPAVPEPQINVKLNSTTSNTVYLGNYLALEISNSSSESNLVYTDQYGYLNSPDTDPGYPMPEVAAGILLAIGLTGVGIYIALNLRRNRGRTTT